MLKSVCFYQLLGFLIRNAKDLFHSRYIRLIGVNNRERGALRIHFHRLAENGFATLGTGHVDVEGVLRFLKEKGYAGDYLVEADGFAGDPEEACRTSYRFLQGKLI